MEKEILTKIKIFILLVFVVVVSVGNVDSSAAEKSKKIYKNIYIDNINVSNMTKVEAKMILEKYVEENSSINLKYKERNFDFKLKDLNVIYDIDVAVDEAYNIGRNKNFFENIKIKINLSKNQKQEIKLKHTKNEEIINKFLEEIKNQINTEPIDSTIKLEEDKFIVTKDTIGVEMDVVNLKERLFDKIENLNIKICDIPVFFNNAKYQYDGLSKINSKLGSYETIFDEETIERNTNIKVAADAINNTILNNNEEFSFNKYMSDKRVLSQFKEAPIIVNGQVKKGHGGGICQVSSTMYNAALYSGLKISSIKNHTIPSSYIEKGRDATVSLGAIDFKFINNLNYPILIVNKVEKNKIISTIYGSDLDKKNIDIVTEINEVPNKVLSKTSESLYVGEEKIMEKGRKGYKVNTYRIFNNDHDKIKEFIYESYYPPLDKQIHYGVKEKQVIENRK